MYWRESTSTELGPAIKRYLRRQRLGVHDVELLQAYIQQWIMAPVWDQMSSPDTGAALINLRARIGRLYTEAAIRHWTENATAWGLTPF